MFLACLRQFVTVVMLTSIATVVIAYDAPVYDVDNFPPPIDNPQRPKNASPETDTGSSSSFKPSESKEEVQALTEDQRITRLEQQIKNQVQSISNSKIETMRTEIQSLRAQVEELSHQLQQMQNQQRSMYTDLDKRLTDKSTKEKPLPIAEAVATPKNSEKLSIKPDKDTHEQPNIAEEQKIYQTAYDFIKVKKYNEAVATLQKMLQKYPEGQFAANAHYWLGELYGLLNKNDQAANEFTSVIKNYPASSKVPDAELKLGLIYAAQFRWTDAKATFKKVVTHYPGTASARLASEQLKQLKQTQAAPGH
ncbi:MAG: bamD 2 [Gammaproteobacteria bacterium]|jgi:tol-pal system protein YbgF|nr:bamD 2 [Gammaproteobacteria bacterium]